MRYNWDNTIPSFLYIEFWKSTYYGEPNNWVRSHPTLESSLSARRILKLNWIYYDAMKCRGQDQFLQVRKVKFGEHANPVTVVDDAYGNEFILYPHSHTKCWTQGHWYNTLNGADVGPTKTERLNQFVRMKEMEDHLD